MLVWWIFLMIKITWRYTETKLCRSWRPKCPTYEDVERRYMLLFSWNLLQYLTIPLICIVQWPVRNGLPSFFFFEQTLCNVGWGGDEIYCQWNFHWMPSCWTNRPQRISCNLLTFQSTDGQVFRVFGHNKCRM